MRYHANAGKVLDAQHVWIDIDVHGLGCFLEPVLIVLVLFMVMLRLFDRLGDLHSLLEFGKEPRFDLEFWQLSAWW
jgi:predicted CDP-diglyceride synthetase/phosphatidate cytidylyltransferase